MNLKSAGPPLLNGRYIQYGARDKFLSGVVGWRTAGESVAIVASAAGESLAKAKRIVTDSPQKLELSAASLLSGDVINKSLSGVKDWEHMFAI